MSRELKYRMSETAEAFHAAEVGSYEFKGARGPVGNGKSVMCCWDVRFKAEMQPAVEITDRMPDGKFHKVRWSKFLFGRQSFPQLKQTTVPTWKDWFPDTRIVESPPMHGRLEVPSMRNDGTWVRIDIVFYAFESPTIENDLMSLELSGAYINEASEIAWHKIHLVNTRIGRFQPVKGVELLSFGVIMDTNSPNESNWWHNLEQIDKPDRMLWFVHPPALIRTTGPDGKTVYLNNDERNAPKYGLRPAENISNLRGGFEYYRKQLVGASDDYIKRMLLNQFGTANDGLPIYPEWNPDVHVVPAGQMKFFRGLPVICGTDFGLTPAMVFMQIGPDGIIRVQHELTSERMTLSEFIDDMLRPALVVWYGYPNGPTFANFADPAGLATGQQLPVTCIGMLNNVIPTCAAPGLKNNDFVIRRDAVSDQLRRMHKGQPAFIVSDECKTLIKGFNGWYCYKKLRAGSDAGERYADGPDKSNFYTHVHDALQYGVLGATQSGIDFSSPGNGGRNDYSGLVGGFVGGYV